MTEPVIHKNHIDDILTGVTPKEPDFAKKDAEPVETPEVHEDKAEDKKEAVTGEVEEKVEEKEPEQEEKKAEAKEDEQNVDDYGNEVDKPRLYSDEDVQRMIKERLSRSHYAQQPVAQIQQAAQDFKADPNSEESWEVQLESFVEKTFDKIATKKQTLAWQEKEQQRQVDFELKFTSGMNKYKDFRDVVGKMPITDSVMLATRDMKDPAAFLYAASKMQPDELKRIAALDDPFSQARELGRLDERMKKARNISSTPPPLKTTKGDISEKYVPKKSLETRIDEYAKVRRR